MTEMQGVPRRRDKRTSCRAREQQLDDDSHQLPVAPDGDWTSTDEGYDSKIFVGAGDEDGEIDLENKNANEKAKFMKLIKRERQLKNARIQKKEMQEEDETMKLNANTHRDKRGQETMRRERKGRKNEPDPEDIPIPIDDEGDEGTNRSYE